MTDNKDNKNIAFIFPGQGAQYIGMGSQLYESSPVAREIFDKAGEVLGFDIKKLMFEGPQEGLKSTVNCQPAILIHSIASLRALEANSKYSQIKPRFIAGLSVGEYSALVAAGVLSFENGLSLLRKRAELMDKASKMHLGAMAAVLALDKEKLREICDDVGVEIANLNCPGQIVISGEVKAINKAKDLALKAGARNVVILEVSGAFHSSLMKSIVEEFKRELENTEFSNAEFPVISNVTSREETQPEQIRKNLEEQLYSSVLWEDSIRYIVSQGVSCFFEIGPNKILKGLLRRIDSSLTVNNIEKPQDLDSLP